MGLFKLKDFWKSSVYVTPNLPMISTKRYKVPLTRLLAYVSFYTFVIAIGVITLLTFTDAKNIIFLLERSEMEYQAQRIEKLEKQVLVLSNELKGISSTDRRLRYAFLLADSTDLDTNSAIYDSLKKPDPDIKPNEGNVLAGLFNFAEFLWNTVLPKLDSTDIFFINPVAGGVVLANFKPDAGPMGIDIVVKPGTPVYASDGGLIIFDEYTVQDGYQLILEHPNKYYSIYKHCSELLKKEREYVRQGELIALSGNSGFSSSGPHLHFEIWQNAKPQNPAALLIN